MTLGVRRHRTISSSSSELTLPDTGSRLVVGDRHRQEGDVESTVIEADARASRRSRRRCRFARGTRWSRSPTGHPVALQPATGGRARRRGRSVSRSNRAERSRGSWAEGAWTCQTRAPRREAALGDRRGESAGGDVGDRPDVVDGCESCRHRSRARSWAACTFSWLLHDPRVVGQAGLLEVESRQSARRASDRRSRISPRVADDDARSH